MILTIGPYVKFNVRAKSLLHTTRKYTKTFRESNASAQPLCIYESP